MECQNLPVKESADTLNPSEARLRLIRTAACALCVQMRYQAKVVEAHCASHEEVAVMHFIPSALKCILC